jgi:peptide methionine sulfoxide reductase MsrA
LLRRQIGVISTRPGFYSNDEQRLTALDTIADVEVSGLWPGKVVTEVASAGRFWEANEDDQDYLQKHPDGETCRFVRPGWKLPRRQTRTT